MKKIKIGDILEIQPKSKVKAGEGITNGKYPFYTCSNELTKSVNTADYEGDALIMGTGGMASIHYEKGKFSTSTDCLVYKSNKNVNLSLINKYLRTNIYLLENGFKGAGLRHISRDYISNITIPLPDRNLQDKIVKELDLIEKTITNHNDVLKKYDTLIKSRFIEMFGDKPVENGKWKVEKLGNLGLCKNGMNFSYEDNGFEINCLGVGDFKDNAVISDCEKLPVISLNEKPSEEYLLKDNDIVFVRSNGNKELVGRSVLVHPRVLTTFSGFCIRFRLSTDSINHLFLLQFLKMPNTRKNMAGRGANIQNLNQQILSNLDIPVPQIELQNDFASFVQQIDKSKFEIANSLKRLYNKGMLS